MLPQTLFFGISADAGGRTLLEEYIFNFDFSDGTARLDLTTDGKKFSSSKAAAGQVTSLRPSVASSAVCTLETCLQARSKKGFSVSGCASHALDRYCASYRSIPERHRSIPERHSSYEIFMMLVLCILAYDANMTGAAMARAQGVSEVKFQVIRLMRMLVQICQTLETVPEEVRSHMLRRMWILTAYRKAIHLLAALDARSIVRAAVLVHEDELPRRNTRLLSVTPVMSAVESQQCVESVTVVSYGAFGMLRPSCRLYACRR